MKPPCEWDDHHKFLGLDGQDLQFSVSLSSLYISVPGPMHFVYTNCAQCHIVVSAADFTN